MTSYASASFIMKEEDAEPILFSSLESASEWFQEKR